MERVPVGASAVKRTGGSWSHDQTGRSRLATTGFSVSVRSLGSVSVSPVGVTPVVDGGGCSGSGLWGQGLDRESVLGTELWMSD